MRALALALTVLTGFSGLVYQVAWQKVLATLLGSHSEAVAAVLGIFLGGLALGYWIFGRVSQHLVARAEAAGGAPPLLLVYGCVEAAVGLHAIAFSWLFAGVRALSGAVPVTAPAAAFAVDVGLTVLLIGPATVAMGGTIPLLTQGLARGLHDATRFHAWVYAFNTVGAFGGALAAAFVLVPALGLTGCILAMGFVNLLAGAAFLVLGRRPSAAPAPGPVAPAATSPLARFAPWAAVALLSGFAMMTLQTAVNRIGGLALGASHLTFAMVVATFVLCIAIGSFAVSLAPRIPRLALPVTQWALVASLLVLAPLLQDSGYWAYRLRLLFSQDASDFIGFQLAIFASLFGVALVPIALSGALLPLLFDHLRERVGDLGRVAGSLYGWNTLGSLVGALVGGYALFFFVDLEQAVELAIAGLALGAAILTWETTRSRVATCALPAAALALLLVPGDWSHERLSSGTFRLRAADERFRDTPDAFYEAFFAGRAPDSLVFYDDDPTSSVAVIRFDRPHETALSIATNGKSDGNVPDDNATMGLAGLLPALFTPSPERAFVIGYGTGTTVSALERLESIEDVLVAEISPAVLDAARLFEPVNGGVLADPRTRIVRGDAYRALLRLDERFDVIVSEPSNPWVTGVEMLFAREFLEAARDRLSDDGVYAQWMHRYETDDESIALVLRTYLAVFPRISVWMPIETDLILLGFRDPSRAADLGRIEERFAAPDLRAAFAAFGIDSLAELAAHEAAPLDALHPEDLAGPLHTLMHPRLSDQAARAFFQGAVGRLPLPTRAGALDAATRDSLVQRLLAGRSPAEADALRAEILRETCSFHPVACASLAASWRRDDPHGTIHATLAGPRGAGNLRTRQALSLRTLGQVGLLVDAEAAARLPATYESAARLEGLFREFHHYAADMDRTPVDRAWERCFEDPRCRERGR